MHKTDELRTQRIDSLMTPQQIIDSLPVSPEIADNVLASRDRIEKIISGKDHRLLVVIGPCSIHDPAAAIDYAAQLNLLRQRYRVQLEVVMRAYFEKPRTTIGWKGLISDPLLDGSCQVNLGITLARKLLLAINQSGLPTATEFLDMVTGQYIADLISWGAIGARTTESQIHREMASALSCPVGFKNGTDGNIRIAIDAIRAANSSHMFLSPDKNGQMTIYQTAGNPWGHLVMRGGKRPNYGAADIAAACKMLRTCNLTEYLLVDLSHANCQKIYQRQLDVAVDISRQIHAGTTAIIGVMAESFLVAGAQKIHSGQALIYGQSITDPCLGLAETEQLLAILAEAVDSRMSSSI